MDLSVWGIWELGWPRLFCRPRRAMTSPLPPQSLQGGCFHYQFGSQASSNKEIFAEADVIFLGVKPAQFSDLLSQYQTILGKTRESSLISMVAGLTLEKLASLIPSQHRIIRMMPNTLLLSGKGVISYALSPNCRSEDSELFCQLLAKAGLLS